jgi:hypothetical protein
MALTKVKGSGLATGAATASLVGIDDNATSTAITIDASENVALTSDLTVKASTTTGIKAEAAGNLTHYNDATPIVTAHRQQWSSVYTATEIVSTLNGAAGELSFKTAANWTNNNATERMKITSDGYVRLAGAGIQFNGDTAAANALDDYEEGTFTATLAGTSAQPATLVTTTGYYTKIGDVINYTIGYEAVDTTGYSGQISITGLPFTSLSVSAANRAPSTITAYKAITFTEHLTAIVENSTTIVRIYITKSAAIWAAATHNPGTGRYIWISGKYHV